MDLTPKQQTSEAIRQADTILILTGQHPSVDQVTAVIALAAILRKFGKTTTAMITDNPPASVQVLDVANVERNLGGSRDFVLKLDVSKVGVDKVRSEIENSKLNIYLTPTKGSFAPSDVTFGYGESNILYDLAIVLGVPTRARIDRAYEQNSVSFESIPLVNLDFHRSNENYGAVNLIEPNASSLCEMLVALSESLQSGIIDADIATALLMGIVSSTDRFTAAHTSPKSLTVAAQMMAAGARQQVVVKALFRDTRPETRSVDRQDRGDRNERNSGDRTSAERQERPNERSNERSPERNMNDRNTERSDRNDRSARNTERAVQLQPSGRPPTTSLTSVASESPALTQAPQQPLTQQPQDRLAPQNVLTPQTAVRKPEELTSESDLPIIQPSHIEMSEPQPPRTPERPQAMPVADFAAAAEMFKLQPAARENQPEQDAS